MDKNEQARQLLLESRNCFSDVLEDTETGEEWYFPKNSNEVDQHEAYLKRIKALKPDDPEVIAQIREDEEALAYNRGRSFMGSKFLMVVFGLVVAYLFYTDVYDPIAKDYNDEQATSFIKTRVSVKQDALKLWNSNPEKQEKYAAKIKQYQKDIEELNAYDPADYARKLNRQNFWKGILSLPRIFFLLAILVAYFYASLAPNWLIEKRERRFNLFKKSAGLLKWLTVGLFTLVMSMPTAYITKTLWSDGSTTTDTDLGPLYFKLVALFLLVSCLVIACMVLLPVMTVVNYLRNYQNERINSYLNQIWMWIKVKVGLEKVKTFNV